MPGPAPRTLNVIANTALAGIYTDPKDGATVTVVRSLLTGIATAVLYELVLPVPLEEQPSLAYQDGGVWMRTWQAEGVTVVLRGEGATQTGLITTANE